MKTLVLATASPVRQALLSFLSSVPGLEILPAGNGKPADPAANPPAPDLVILEVNESGTTGDDWQALRRLAGQWAPARFLVVVQSLRQLDAALAAGADRALLAGFSAAEFFEALRALEPVSSTRPTKRPGH